MKDAICLLPVIPMRKEPSHRSEMVSQVLFGEYVQMGEEKDDFVFVQCRYDGYEGWVQATQIISIDTPEKLDTTEYTSAFVTPVAVNNALQYIPYGCPVYRKEGFEFTISGNRVQYLLQPQQIWQSSALPLSAQTLESICQPYINVPYLWGGKSVFGTDCSGFVQQVFKILGIKLLRDAYLQAQQGSGVSSAEEARLGDLAFFQNDKGRVTHVGIVLNEGKIIHASGQVRIDSLHDGGIINIETWKQTHVLHSVRRFF